MMVFWIVALLLIAAALLLLLPPLLQTRDTTAKTLARDEVNVLLFKDQSLELAADLEAGTITQEQHDQAYIDLERGLLQDVNSGSAEITAGSRFSNAGKFAAMALGVVVPVAAIILYQVLGAGAPGIHPEEARADVQAEGHQGTIEEQVRKLQDHLITNPDDLEGQVMLARSYYFMKQYQAASDAFARAVSMTNEGDAQLLADYADAMAMASGRSMVGQPFDLVKKALQIDPAHQKALWLAATATYQSKDYGQTLQYWQRLLQQFPKGSDNYKQMLRNIAEVKQLLGQPIDDIVAELQEVPPTAAPQVTNGSAADDGTNSGAAGASVTGVASLDAALQNRVAPTDTVFIFARAAQGPRMPLAIIRKQVKDLPISFTLDDSMAMNPQMKMSAFPQVVVGARISKSGNAMPQSGDLKGEVGPIALGASNLQVHIDSAVP